MSRKSQRRKRRLSPRLKASERSRSRPLDNGLGLTDRMLDNDDVLDETHLLAALEPTLTNRSYGRREQRVRIRELQSVLLRLMYTRFGVQLPLCLPP